MLDVIRELWAADPAACVAGTVLCPALLALVAQELVRRLRAVRAAARAEDAAGDGW